MTFEVESGLEGLVDRLDGLAQRLEQCRAGPFGLALAGWAQQFDTGVGQVAFEVAAVVLPVGDQDLAGPLGRGCGVGVEAVEQGGALFGLGPGQREGERQPAQGADQVQTQAPEGPGV